MFVLVPDFTSANILTGCTTSSVKDPVALSLLTSAHPIAVILVAANIARVSPSLADISVPAVQLLVPQAASALPIL